VTAYFTGVRPKNGLGHFCYVPGFLLAPTESSQSPWSSSRWWPLGDSDACQAVGGYGEQVQGQPKLVHKQGWTLLHLWDRSGDRRKNSHASFAFDKELEPSEALSQARVLFPGVLERIEKHLGLEIVPELVQVLKK